MDASRMPNGVAVTRIEAGTSLLHEAIRMFFDERDAIATHTIAAAASLVLHDLAATKGVRILTYRIDMQFGPARVQAVDDAAGVIRQLFKHIVPDSFPKESGFEFSPEETAFVLFSAVMAANALGVANSSERSGYIIWFMRKYPGVLGREARPAWAGVEPTSRAEFKDLIGRQPIVPRSLRCQLRLGSPPNPGSQLLLATDPRTATG